MTDFRLEGLNELVADLAAAPVRAGAGVRAVVQHGCANIKRDAQQFSSGLAHAPAYPASITYETTETAGLVTGEVGPDKDRPQGALGNLLEYGSVNNAPLAHMGPAFDLEQPRFVAAINAVAGEALP